MRDWRKPTSDEEGTISMSVPAPDASRGVYGISVAAELVGMGTQTLRLYESRGLLEPERTGGGTRRYSAADLERLRRIGDLLDGGLNLAGIAMVLDLETQNAQLRANKGGRAMAHDRSDATAEIPEADWLEQQMPADAEGTGDELSPVPDQPVPDTSPVDPADRLEQLTSLPGEEDDEYPHD